LYRCAARRERYVSEEAPFHFQYRRVYQTGKLQKAGGKQDSASTLKMEAIYSSENVGYNIQDVREEEALENN
jgi:hypothetical protein